MCTWKGCCWERGTLLGTQGTLGAATLLAVRPEAMPVAEGIFSIDMVQAGLSRSRRESLGWGAMKPAFQGTRAKPAAT